MADLTTTALHLVEQYGLLAIVVFTFLESSMLFPFLPSEVVVPAAAALLIQDITSFVAFVGGASVGGTVGAFVPFYAFHGPGAQWAGRLRDYVHISDDTVDYGRRWFHNWGASSVLWGRFLPGLRSVISIPAGLVDMDPRWFGVFTAVGSVGFYTLVAAVVYVARQRSVSSTVISGAVKNPMLAALTVVGVVVAVGLVTVWYRRMLADLGD